MEAKIFDKGMALLLANFRNLKVGKEDLKTWRMLLCDVENEGFMAAIIAICKSHKEIYPGTNLVALIREESERYLYGEIPSPEEAWAQIMAHRGRDNMHELAKKALDALGGWSHIGRSQEDQLGMIRAHFFKIYEAFKKRGERTQLDQEIRELLPDLVKSMPRISQGGYSQDDMKYNEDMNKLRKQGDLP